MVFNIGGFHARASAATTNALHALDVVVAAMVPNGQ
jgi:hypothetical protein